MKSSTCIITILVISSMAVSASAINDPPSSAEITDELPMVPGEKRSRFHSGSRYGRSQGGADAGSAGTDTVRVAPRNNRFFTGSRYGKRSEEFVQPVYSQESPVNYDVQPFAQKLDCNYKDYIMQLRCLWRNDWFRPQYKTPMTV